MAGVPSAPHTVRLFVPEEKKSSCGVVYVQKKILEEILRMPHESIFCLQAFPQQGFFDATFRCQDEMRTCYLRSQENLSHPDISGFRFVPNEAKRRVPVVVHMYNPFVKDIEIQAFLRRYCSYVSGAEWRRNPLGTFNGMRRFWVEFRKDSAGIDGLCHPPQNFSIGTNRGFLNYPDQPSFCRGCYKFGHTREDCGSEPVCRNCFKPGHRTADCEEARKCHFCGSSEHLARQCPTVPGDRTYSAVVRGEVVVALAPPEENPDPGDSGGTVETESIVVDHLAAEGEEAHVPAKATEDPKEMDIEKASLKRKPEKSVEEEVVPPSANIGEFSSPEEGTEDDESPAIVDSDASASSSHDKAYLQTTPVKRLAMTMGFSKSVEDIKKNKVKHPGSSAGSRGRREPRT